MDVLTAIQGRRSIRSYSPQKIEEEKLIKVLEAARLAPSANNKQNWKFVVVRDDRLREKMISASFDQQFVGQAPAIIVACGTEPSSIMRCGQYRYTIDLSIAVSYMTLEAYEQGLGTCWIGSFDEGAVKKLLNIPDEVRVVAITPLGYPAATPDPRPRKPLEDIVCYDTYRSV